MRVRHVTAVVVFVISAASIAAAQADRWWTHVTTLADDKFEGRATGTDGYRRAAEYVAEEFRRAGLSPAGVNGFMQPVAFRSRRIIEERSSLALVRNNGSVESVALGDDAVFSVRIAPAAEVDAPLVFVGHGLRIPEAKINDFAGLDLRGKVAVLLTGGPAGVPGPLLAHYQSSAVRWETLEALGAIGTISIANPKNMDIPWERSMLARLMPAFSLSDPALDDLAGQRVAISFNPARANALFAGASHTFDEMLALAAQQRALPRFELPSRVRATVAVATDEVESANVVGVLPGQDATLKDEYVVLSAHLDHLGVGNPINGDAIYNGALDNAAGVATLIETAAALRDAKTPLKRSVLFIALTGEEQGLLGSRYFAGRPTVPARALVANMNADMYLPIVPLKSVIGIGEGESDLAADLRRAANAVGVAVLPDPEPQRNIFVRSDQYSFVRVGVPALFFRVGFADGSPEQGEMNRWLRERYHAPSDDIRQPVDRHAAEAFNKLFVALTESIANRPDRPRWNADSFFRRFSTDAERP